MSQTRRQNACPVVPRVVPGQRLNLASLLRAHANTAGGTAMNMMNIITCSSAWLVEKVAQTREGCHSLDLSEKAAIFHRWHKALGK